MCRRGVLARRGAGPRVCGMRRADARRMRNTAWLAGMMLLAGCSAPCDPRDSRCFDPSVVEACPATLPEDGAPCFEEARVCGVYIDCDTFGAGSAECVNGEWRRDRPQACPSAISCVSGSSELTCRPGEVCRVRIGGSVDGACIPAPSGPVHCATVCGGPCVQLPSSLPLEGPPWSYKCDACSGECA